MVFAEGKEGKGEPSQSGAKNDFSLLFLSFLSLSDCLLYFGANVFFSNFFSTGFMTRNGTLS